MRRLWGRANSSNVMKVIWLLEELGLPYERLDVGGSFGKTDTAEYRAMNPNGLVPTLEEDGFILWESNAILRYLCHAHAPHSPLWPQEPRPRANVDRWMDWQQTTLNRPISVIFWGLVRTPPEKRDRAAIDAAVKDCARVWGMLEAELACHPYVGGAHFTIGDIPLGVHVHRWFAMEFDRPPFPHLKAWYGRLLERAPYRAHVAQKLS
ncbi:MAG: glutathione S-transferase family protein [Rhodospirillales bacterium]|nr:glutathione S-transferase family protein [Rhodospirillales bacterium]